MKIATVDYEGTDFWVECPFYDNTRAKTIPDRKWDRKNKKWRVPMSGANVRYLSKEYNDEEYTASARDKIREFSEQQTNKSLTPFPSWFPFKYEPMKHQKEVLNQAWGKNEFAIFHEMGCGKTFSAICLAAAYAMEGSIQAVLVLCPTPIKHIWPAEIGKFSPLGNEMIYVMKPGARGFKEFIESDHDSLKVLVVGIESLSQGNAYKYAERFLFSHRAMAILDESTKIKTPNKNRTERAINLAGFAKKRLILNGSPITQGMQDLYSQFAFLNWDIIGHKSYFTFRNRYCVMGGFDEKQVVGYQNVDELLSLVEPFSHSVSKDEALDLPPKVFESRIVTPTKYQLKAMGDLKEEMIAEMESNVVEVRTALDRLTRYRQICGGMFPYETGEVKYVWKVVGDKRVKVPKKIYKTKPFPGPNPKLVELASVIEDIPSTASIIIWAAFRPEIAVISEYLESKWPGQTIQYHGGTEENDREAAVTSFQNKEKKFFVSNQSTGGIGLTLTAATYVVYFSNDYSYYYRVQSEDRAHRKGQDNKVTYIDLVLNVKTEKEIIRTLQNKGDIADMVNDRLRSGNIIDIFDS